MATMGIVKHQDSAECGNLVVIARNISGGLAWFEDFLCDGDGPMGFQGDFFA